MKRAPIVLAGTVAGLAGVLSFHTNGNTITVSSGGTATSASGATGGSGGSGGSAGSPSSSASSSSSSSSSSSPSGGSAGTGSSSGTSHPSGTTATTQPASGGSGASATGVRSAKGALENFGYGVMAVKVTVDGSRITSVTVPTLQVAEPTSQQICQEAIPMLHSEVLSAQSARINAISGATYTSEAYDYSLQSALDKLHVK